MGNLTIIQPTTTGLSLADLPTSRRIELAIAAWLDAKSKRSGSQKTTAAYRAELLGFRAALAVSGGDLDGAAAAVALAAQLWAGRPGGRGRGHGRDGVEPSPATHNQRLACLSSFYSFALRGELLDIHTNPMARVERRTVQAYASATPLSASIIKRKLAAIDRTLVAGARDYCILAIALATGRRLGELVMLDWRDLTLQDSGRVHLTWRRMKGGKVGRDLLTASLSVALVTYLQLLHGAATPPAEAPVWVSLASNYRGERLSKQAIANICRDRLGVSTVHSLRHTFARAMEQAGAKVSDVQSRLGHASLATTGRYLAALASAENQHADAIGEMFGI